MALGTIEIPVYYYHLTSIAIDMASKMEIEKNMGRGWAKLPKNKTNVIVKILERLLALKKKKDDEHVLDHNRIIGILSNVWGSVWPAATIYYNDRVRVFGIIMPNEENRYIYQRLAEGYTTRQSIDDPNFSRKQIFQTIAFSYNNKSVHT